MEPILIVENLKTHFYTQEGVIPAVDGVSFEVFPGKTLGLVGESGCGKSAACLSILRLIPEPPGKLVDGTVRFNGVDLLSLPIKELRKIRGKSIAMIFQEPMSSLNPLLTCGYQVLEVLVLKTNLSKAEAKEKVYDLFESLGIPSPKETYKKYPHELSGGMQQRVMIALALSCQPRVLIADEPTTALDVTIQAQILALLKSYQKSSDMGIILITHNMGIIAEAADEVAVMYAGKIQERASRGAIFSKPLHPYTKGLLDSIPKIGADQEYLAGIKGSVPSALDFPRGCRFHPRCAHADDICRNTEPELRELYQGHFVRCWRAESLG